MSKEQLKRGIKAHLRGTAKNNKGELIRPPAKVTLPSVGLTTEQIEAKYAEIPGSGANRPVPKRL